MTRANTNTRFYELVNISMLDKLEVYRSNGVGPSGGDGVYRPNCEVPKINRHFIIFSSGYHDNFLIDSHLDL